MATATLVHRSPVRIHLTRRDYLYRGHDLIELTPRGVAKLPAGRRLAAEISVLSEPYHPDLETSWCYSPATGGEYSHHDIEVHGVTIRHRRQSWSVWAVTHISQDIAAAYYPDYHQIPATDRQLRYVAMVEPSQP